MEKIRENPISFAECDSFDEVCKFVNKIYGYLREQRQAIETQQTVIEGLNERLNALSKKPKSKRSKT